MSAAAARYPGRAAIDAYGNGGFRFADMSHRGAILCLPSGVHAWEAGDAGDVQALAPEAFASVLAEREAVELLLLGAGRSLTRPRADVRQAFLDAGVRLEVMDTGAACRTYNVLLAEGRSVGAALMAVD